MDWNSRGPNRVPFPAIEGGLHSVEVFPIIPSLFEDEKRSTRKRVFFRFVEKLGPRNRHRVKREVVAHATEAREDGSSKLVETVACSLMNCAVEGDWRERVTTETATDGSETVTVERLATPTAIILNEHEYGVFRAAGCWPPEAVKNVRRASLGVRVYGRPLGHELDHFVIGEFEVVGGRDAMAAELAALNGEEV